MKELIAEATMYFGLFSITLTEHNAFATGCRCEAVAVQRNLLRDCAQTCYVVLPFWKLTIVVNNGAIF
jgi:hypothetical protein